ncbi:MAG: hypothetical protein ACLR06_16565 [Christensenellaceae bacterium]
MFDGAGGLLGRFSLGETCELTESGTYTVTAVNHYGVSEAFTLVISLAAPEVSLTENEAEKTRDSDLPERGRQRRDSDN